MFPSRYNAGPPNRHAASAKSRCPSGCAMVISSATALTTMPATMGMWKYVYTARATRPGSVEPAIRADVEVDPPHGDAAEECDQECAYPGRGRGVARGGGTRDQDGLAERNDHEQR